jgi:hypothetical protein
VQIWRRQIFETSKAYPSRQKKTLTGLAAQSGTTVHLL